MAGFSNDQNLKEIVYADNVDFSGGNVPAGQFVSDGQLMIGSSVAPNIRISTLTSSDSSITWTFGHGTINGVVTGASAFGKTITGNTGGAISPSGGNWNLTGTGSLTVAGSGSTLTPQLTGLTNHNVLVGAGTATITNVAPSATSGVPLISQGASSDPAFGTAVVAGGGTGVATFGTPYGVICAGTTATGALQVIAALGSSGQILTSNGAGALPTFQAAPASGIPTIGSSTNNGIVTWNGTTGSAVNSTATTVSSTGIINGPNGTVGAPTYSFTSDTASGMLYNGTNHGITISNNNSTSLTIDTGSVTTGRTLTANGTFQANSHVQFAADIVYSAVTISSTGTLNPNAYFYQLDSTTNTITLTLPAAPTPGAGYTCVLLDYKGNAATHNITVQVASSGTINGNSTFVINTTYGSCRLFYTGTSGVWVTW